jgi:S-formylglutathione hydrolase FrmB
MDFTERPFRWHEPIDSLSNRKAFGPSGSGNRVVNDPFELVEHADVLSSPFFYIVVGDKDLLFAANQRFANELNQYSLHSEFHVLPGAHNWDTWNAMLPSLEAALLQHFNQPNQTEAERPGSLHPGTQQP